MPIFNISPKLETFVEICIYGIETNIKKKLGLEKVYEGAVDFAENVFMLTIFTSIAF